MPGSQFSLVEMLILCMTAAGACSSSRSSFVTEAGADGSRSRR